MLSPAHFGEFVIKMIILQSYAYFHILKNITHIFIYFFTHTYIKNTQTTFFKLLYQTGSRSSQYLGLFGKSI